MIGTNTFGLAYFLPSIVNSLGFSPNKSQLLSVGPFTGGFVVTVMLAYFSDRYKTRAIPIVVVSLLAVAGYATFLASTAKYTSYGALYLMVPGIAASTPIIATWISNNSEPHYRRATSIALGFVAANSGGILSTWSYPSKEGPKFRKTTIMNLSFTLFIISLTIINALMLSYANKRKKEKRTDILAPFSTEEPGGGVHAWVELGDRHPDFRYVI
jgi:MFS family permease